MLSKNITLKDIAHLNSVAAEIESQIQADILEDRLGTQYNFKNIRYYKIKETDAEFVVFEQYTEEKIICFKGTDSLKDWEYNLDFLPIKLKDTELKVHGGFYKHFNSLRCKLKEEMNDSTKLILTGHSLGGALATLAGCYVHSFVPNILKKVITFGSPRVMCTEFCNWYNERLAKKTIRIYDIFDPVPHLPPHGPVFEYEHVDGVEIKFKNSNILGNTEEGNFVKRFVETMRGFLRTAKDHTIDSYIEDMEMHGKMMDLIQF